MASVASLISPQDPSKYFTFIVHTIMKPSIESKVEEVLSTTMECSSECYALIFNYLKDGTFPEPIVKNIRAHLQKFTSRYIILADVLQWSFI